MRLDSVALGATTSLESYLTSGWIDGVIASSLEAGTVNGLPASFATARAGEWNFRIALIRLGGDVFRLIFAARTLNEDVEKRFRASIDTFRKLDAAEVSAIRPQKLAIVAGGSETVATMAARMKVVDRPNETFQLLNGLGPTDALNPARSYKVVVE